MAEKKKDIFNLFQREKKITISDDDGNKVDILFVKINQLQRRKILENYTEDLAKVRLDLKEKDDRLSLYTRGIMILDKASLIKGIVQYQISQRREILDLFPIENAEAMTLKEKEEKENQLISDWEKNKIEELNSKTPEELQRNFKDMVIEGLSIVEATRKVDLMMLQAMCLDPETKEPIFKTYSDVEKVVDMKILEQLIKELNDFNNADTSKQTRIVADSEDFLASGESQEKSESSPSSMNTTS